LGILKHNVNIKWNTKHEHCMTVLYFCNNQYSNLNGLQNNLLWCICAFKYVLCLYFIRTNDMCLIQYLLKLW